MYLHFIVKLLSYILIFSCYIQLCANNLFFLSLSRITAKPKLYTAVYLSFWLKYGDFRVFLILKHNIEMFQLRTTMFLIFKQNSTISKILRSVCFRHFKMRLFLAFHLCIHHLNRLIVSLSKLIYKISFYAKFLEIFVVIFIFTP